MNFHEAMEEILRGRPCYRRGWPGVRAGNVVAVYLDKGVVTGRLDGPPVLGRLADCLVVRPVLARYEKPAGGNVAEVRRGWSPEIDDLTGDDWKVLKKGG